jgi:phosphoribosylformimino-5-aminoimidazole carboxamide ribotide isomerase
VTAPIQFGGGLRTLDDIQLALELGAERVVLGTVAVDNPQLVADAILRFGAKRIVIGLDAKDGKVATHGWQSVSTHDVVELGHQMAAMGVQLVLYTDISRDGMLSGVNVEATSRLGDITGLQVIASGGVAGIEDIERLKRHEHYGIDGVIVGQALYTGRLDLAQAIATARQPIRRRSAGLIPVRTGRHGVEFLLLFNLFFEQWQFPRGGVRPAESDMACALREFSEETGLPVGKVHEACRTELNYSVQIRNLEMRRTIVYYLAEIKVGDLRLGHDNHSEARWVTAQEAWELLSETSPEQMPALDAALAYLTEQG